MPVEEGEYTVEVDPGENRLSLVLSGPVDEAAVEAAADAALGAADDLTPGFGVVLDISAFRPRSRAVTDAVERCTRTLAERGAAAVVRVAGASAGGPAAFAPADGGRHQVATVENRGEARSLLDEFDPE